MVKYLIIINILFSGCVERSQNKVAVSASHSSDMNKSINNCGNSLGMVIREGNSYIIDFQKCIFITNLHENEDKRISIPVSLTKHEFRSISSLLQSINKYEFSDTTVLKDYVEMDPEIDIFIDLKRNADRSKYIVIPNFPVNRRYHKVGLEKKLIELVDHVMNIVSSRKELKELASKSGMYM